MTKRFAAPSKSLPTGEASKQLLEIKEQAMIKAEAEMYNSGIVAVGDICNTTDSIPIKEKSNIRWHSFIEVSGFVDAVAEKRFADAKKLSEQWSIVHGSLSIVPHAPYSVSKTLFELINKETTGQLITIHNQECAAEEELYKTKTGKFLELFKNFGIDITEFQPTGKSSLQSYLPYFTHRQSIILVHNTFTTGEDIGFQQFITHNSKIITHFCLCPNANQYIESAFPPINLLRENNCNIVLGTDSLASNHQLNILEEIKTIQQKDPSIPLAEMLQWGTINGAKALQMDEALGSFEKGKKPGVVLINAVENLKLTKSTRSMII